MDRLRLKNDSKTDLQYRLWEAVQPYIALLALHWILGIFGTVARHTAINSPIHIAFSVLASLAAAAVFFLAFPITVGVSRFYLRFIDRAPCNWTDVFKDLKSPRLYLEELKAYMFSYAMIFLGTVCFVLPGIYLALRYSQIRWIFAERPDYTWREAVERSKRLTDGHIFEYFCLIWSFFLWYLLAGITFGIAMIYVSPYTSCAYTRYYKSLCYLYDGNGRSFEGGRVSGDGRYNPITEESCEPFEEIR